MKTKDRKEKFNNEVSDLKRNEQLVCECGKQIDWLDTSIRYCKNCFKTVDKTN